MPSLSKLAKLIADNPRFVEWFKGSKVVGPDGLPQVYYHGTPNLDQIEAFDPSRTGKGHDALGSGFYFTSNPAQANGYAWATEAADQPGVLPAFLSIKNPLVVPDARSIEQADINLTRKQAEKIMGLAPDIRDIESTPLANWIDVQSKGGVTDRMLAEVAENYKGGTLGQLENDFYRGEPTKYREALNRVLGYDGVYGPIDDGLSHYVSWFPEQIKSIWNYGSFDPKDPRVKYAKGGLIKKGVRELLDSPLFHGGTYKSGSTVERPLYMVPDEEFARTYVEANPVEGRRVMRLDPGVGNPAHGDALWELINRYVPDVGEYGYTPASAFDDNLVDQDAITALIRALREKGHDSAIAEDVPMTANGEPQNVLVMFPGDTAHEYAKGGSVKAPRKDILGALTDKQFYKDLAGGAYDTLVGVPAGIAGAPGDLEGLARLVAQYIPGVEGVSEETVLPTADDIMAYLPARDESVRNPYATTAGQLAGGFYTGPGSAARGASALYDTAKAAPRLFTESMSPAVVSNVVKQKGGNWLAGDVENALKGLRNDRIRDADYMEELKRLSEETPQMARDYSNWLKAKIFADPSYQRVPAMDAMESWAKEAGYPLQKREGAPYAMNQWLDQKLAKYIKNEMATPEDPIRALAERGILHVEPGQLRGFDPAKDSDFIGKVRKSMGAQEQPFGSSPAAQMWEGASDMQLGRRSALDAIERSPGNIESNPWLLKVPTDTRINTLMGQNQLAPDLGFDHLTDELRNIIDPNSGLPADLLWKYSDLAKVTVPQAVERVAKVNEWRAANKAEANLALSRNKATVPFKDYPDSDYQWVELRKPETTGKNVSTQIDADSDPDFFINQAHEEALEEGIEEGSDEYDDFIRAYIDALPYDAATNKQLPASIEEDESIAQLREALKYEGDVMQNCVGGKCGEVLDGLRVFSLRNKNTGEPHVTVSTKIPPSKGKKAAEQPPRILEIKGKNNKAPKEDYLPFVQDFVRSGQWSDVGDLGNTGMKSRKSMFTPEALKLPEIQALPEYMTDEEFRAAQKAFAALKKPKFASGGLVSNTETRYNPDRVNALAQSLLDELNG